MFLTERVGCSKFVNKSRIAVQRTNILIEAVVRRRSDHAPSTQRMIIIFLFSIEVAFISGLHFFEEFCEKIVWKVLDVFQEISNEFTFRFKEEIDYFIDGNMSTNFKEISILFVGFKNNTIQTIQICLLH